METNFLVQFEELLEREYPVLLSDVFREFDNWDSLAYLSVISFVDEEYGLVIPREEFGKLKTVGDIYNFILKNKED